MIDRLQPPTTKALLSQQCHLVDFQGSSAIVGISSAKLQRLHQGKVPNIEAAFEKVCQRKIKVRLEVASTTNQKSISDSSSTSAIDLITPSSPSPFIPQVNTETVQSQTVDNTSAQSPSIPDSQTPKYNETVIPINSNVTKSDLDSISSPPVVTSVTPPLIKATKNLRSETDTVLHSLTANEPVVTNKLEFTSDQQNDDNLSSNGVNQNCNSNILQQAIEDLTQSFEGELVELDTVDLSKFAENQIESDRLEAAEELTQPKIATGTENSISENNIDYPPFIAAHTVVNNRPDVSQYDDEDDIPF